MPGSPGIELITVEAWRELPWLLHGFSTRTGGRTTAYRPDQPYGELNLGFTSDDDRATVRANRELLVAHLLGASEAGSKAPSLTVLRQVHSAVSLRIDDPADAGCYEGDGMMTDRPGVLLGILTADCVPVLVADRRRRAVAAFHAGWRGTLARIVESGVEKMRAEFGTQPEDLAAAIGPAIGPCCYTVGEEVRDLFVRNFAYASQVVEDRAVLSGIGTPGPENATPANTAMRLDLPEANRRQLISCGLAPEVITMTGACTSCQTDRFFSHRAEKGRTGRMLAIIGLRG